MKTSNPTIAGFTLIELMIVVAIVAILAAVALPQFLRFSYKAKRSEGVVTLRSVLTSQQAYFASYDSYASGLDTAEILTKIGQGSLSSNLRFYTGSFLVQTSPLGSGAKTNFDVLLSGNIDPTDPVFDTLYLFTPGLPPVFCPASQIPFQINVLFDDVTNSLCT